MSLFFNQWFHDSLFPKGVFYVPAENLHIWAKLNSEVHYFRLYKYVCFWGIEDGVQFYYVESLKD